MDAVFRRVTPEELSLLCRMDVTIFGDDGFDSPEMWDGLACYFIVAGDKKVVGSTAMRLHTGVAENYEEDYLDERGSLYIVSTGLLPEWQGRGIGTAAKAWQICYAKKLGFKKVVTNARASNIRSISLNRKFGFQIVRTVPNWYGDEDAVVMELGLN